MAEGIAGGILSGLESGQQFIANEQQQKVRDKQMAELERAERKRSAMAAIDMSDRGKALAGMQRVAQEYGAPEEYLKYGDIAASDAATAKKKRVMDLAGALEAGDFNTANALGGEFGMKGKIAGFNPKTNSYRMHIPDPKNPDKYTAADVSYDKIQRGLWLAVGGEKAMEGIQHLNLKREQLGIEREKLGIMRRGAGSGGAGGDYKQESFTESGIPIYRQGGQQYITDRTTGRLIPFTQAEERLYGKASYPRPGKGGAGADDMGQYSRSAAEVAKRIAIDRGANPEETIRQHSDLLQQGRTMDMVEALKRGGKSPQDAMEAFGAVSGLTPAHLIAAGFSKDAAEMGYNAAIMRSKRTQ